MSIRSAASRWFLPVLILIAVAGGSLAVAMRGPSDEQRAYKLACEAVRAKLPAELREGARFPELVEEDVAIARTLDGKQMFMSRVVVGAQSKRWVSVVSPGSGITSLGWLVGNRTVHLSP